MATYTVIQDIEAEDKFLGPLTLKQFIFAGAAIFFGYLNFISIAKGVPFLAILFLPPMLLGGFLAVPWSSQQPTEIWALAKLRFHLKPRIRIWNQSGLEELVTITAPKKIERQLTNGLDPTEVTSRLKALAETIDSRGWAVKNATTPDAYTPGYTQDTGERLVDLATLPQPVPDTDLGQYPDMLDEDRAVAAKFENMMQESSQTRVQESLAKMDRVRNGETVESVQQSDFHFAPPADNPQPARTQAVSTGVLDEQTLSQQLRNKRQAGDLASNHLHTVPAAPHISSYGQPQLPTVPPASDSGVQDSAQAQAQMTNTPDPAILNLAQNNDLNIETIARQAKKDDSKDNEVVISLR
jgi:hypothetical protein